MGFLILRPASCFQVTAPTRPNELAAGVAEYIPFQLPEELKKRGAVYSHADTIDAPWAVRSGEDTSRVVCASLTAKCLGVFAAISLDALLALNCFHPLVHTLPAAMVC